MRRWLAIGGLIVASGLAGCDSSEPAANDQVETADPAPDADRGSGEAVTMPPMGDEAYRRSVECLAIFTGASQFLREARSSAPADQTDELEAMRAELNGAAEAIMARVIGGGRAEETLSDDAYSEGFELGQELRDAHDTDGDAIIIDLLERTEGCMQDADMIMGPE